MRGAVLFLLVLITLVFVATAAFAGERTLDSGDVLRWDVGLDEAARRGASMLQAIRQEVEVRLGFPFTGGTAAVV